VGVTPGEPAPRPRYRRSGPPAQIAQVTAIPDQGMDSSGSGATLWVMAGMKEGAG
jgi:hypothetical protein